jgi:hypothetical protein
MAKQGNGKSITDHEDGHILKAVRKMYVAYEHEQRDESGRHSCELEDRSTGAPAQQVEKKNERSGE